MKKIKVINGPNLNLLGQREPEIYGSLTLADISKKIVEHSQKLNIETECFQSNHEGQIIDWIQACLKDKTQGLIINPAAYTHTSVAIADALSMLSIPTIEVHLSNIHKRESFRHHSYVAGVATGQITGLGWYGYILALEALSQRI